MGLDNSRFADYNNMLRSLVAPDKQGSADLLTGQGRRPKVWTGSLA